jgi:hypothetical protein
MTLLVGGCDGAQPLTPSQPAMAKPVHIVK